MYNIDILQRLVISHKIDEISITYVKERLKKYIEEHLLNQKIEEHLTFELLGVSLCIPLHKLEDNTYIITYIKITSSQQEDDIEGIAKVYFSLDGTLNNIELDLY